MKGTQDGKSGISAADSVADSVIAMSCEPWPTEAREWLHRFSERWPTEDMKKYAENCVCFVVQGRSKAS